MGTLVSLSKPETLICLDVSECALVAFAVVVVVGLIGEHRLPWWHVRHDLFAVLIAVGCAGELFADAGIFLCSRHLQTIADAELSSAKTLAGKAEKEAGDANCTAEILRQQNLKLQITLATLQRRAGERFFTPEERKLIVSSLRPYPHNTIEVQKVFGDSEVETYFKAIIGAMGEKGAGWNVEIQSGQIRDSPALGSPRIYGLLCLVPGNASLGILKFISIFRKIGVDVTVPESSGRSGSGDHFRLIVGHHRPYAPSPTTSALLPNSVGCGK